MWGIMGLYLQSLHAYCAGSATAVVVGAREGQKATGGQSSHNSSSSPGVEAPLIGIMVSSESWLLRDASLPDAVAI